MKAMAQSFAKRCLKATIGRTAAPLPGVYTADVRIEPRAAARGKRPQIPGGGLCRQHYVHIIFGE